MLYNKREVRKVNDKKVLHKVKKQWVVLSAFTLALLGAGVIATTNVQADSVSANNEQPKTSNVTQNGKNPSTQPTQQNTQSIMKQAKQMTSTLMANAGQKADHAQSASANQTKPSAASSGNKTVSSVAPSKNATSSTSNSAKQVVSNLASGSKQKATNEPSSVANNGQTSQSNNKGSNSNSASNGNVMTTVQAKPGLLKDINPRMNLNSVNPTDQNNKWIYDPSTQKYVSDGQVHDWQNSASDYDGLNYRYSPSKNALEFTGGTPSDNLSDLVMNVPDPDADNPISVSFSNKISFNNVTNMMNMFQSDRNLQSVNFPSSFNTSNVSDISGMFQDDTSLKSLKLPNSFNTRSVTSDTNIFSGDNGLILQITSPNTKFNDGAYSDMQATKLDSQQSQQEVNLQDGNSHVGTFKLAVVPKKQDKITVYFWYNGQNIGHSDMTGSDDTSDYAVAPNGYAFVNSNESDIQYQSNKTYNLPVAPVYSGMFYTYNSGNNSVEFTKGTLTSNESASDAKSDFHDEYDFYKNAPTNIKNANSLTFDSNIKIGTVSDLSSMFANNNNLQHISLNFKLPDNTIMQSLFANDTQLKSVTFGNQFKTTSLDKNDSDENIDNDKGMFTNDISLQQINNQSSDIHFNNEANLSKLYQKLSSTDEDGQPYTSVNPVDNTNIPKGIFVTDSYSTPKTYTKKIRFVDKHNNSDGVPVNPSNKSITNEQNTNYSLQSSDIPSGFVLDKSTSDVIHFNNNNSDTIYIHPQYDGLNYIYDKNDNAIIFTKGVANSSLSDFTKNSSNLIKDANIITFNSDITSSNVSYMSDMFTSDPNLVEVDFENDTSNVTNMQNMFVNDTNLKDISFGYKFSTKSSSDASDMTGMFKNDNNIKQINIMSPNIKLYSSAGLSNPNMYNTFSTGTDAQNPTNLEDGQNHQGVFTNQITNNIIVPYPLLPENFPNLAQNPSAFTEARFVNVPDILYNTPQDPVHKNDAVIKIFYTKYDNKNNNSAINWSDIPSKYQPISSDNPTGITNIPSQNYKIIGIYKNYTGEGNHGLSNNDGISGYQIAINSGSKYPFGSKRLHRFTPEDINGYIFRPQAHQESSYNPYNTQNNDDYAQDGLAGTSLTNPDKNSANGGDMYVTDEEKDGKGHIISQNQDHDTLSIALSYMPYSDSITYQYGNHTQQVFHSDSRQPNGSPITDNNSTKNYDTDLANLVNSNNLWTNDIPVNNDFPYGLYVTQSDKTKFYNELNQGLLGKQKYQYGRNNLIIPLHEPASITVNYKDNGNIISTPYYQVNKQGTQFTFDITGNIPKGYSLSTINPNFQKPSQFTTTNQVVNVPITQKYTDVINYVYNNKTITSKKIQTTSDQNNTNNLQQRFIDDVRNANDADLYETFNAPRDYNISQMSIGDRQQAVKYIHDLGTDTITIPVQPSQIDIDYVDKSNYQILESKSAFNTIGSSFDISPYLSNLPAGYEYAGINNDSSSDDSVDGTTNVNKNNDNEFDGTHFKRLTHTIYILLIKKAPKVAQSTITVNYLDKATGQKVSPSKSNTEDVSTDFDIGNYLSQLPSGYEYAGIKNANGNDNFNGTEFDYNNHTIDVLLTKVSTTPKIAKSTITVNYLDKVTGQPVAKSKSDTENVSTDFDIGNYLSQLPSDYEYAGIKNANNNDDFNGTEFDYNNHTIDVLLTKAPTPKVAQSTITVNYLDKATGQQVSPSKLDTENVSTNFDIKNYLNNLPQGYKYSGVKNNVDHFDYDNHTVNVLLSKIPSSSSNNPSGTAGLPPFTPMNPIVPTGSSASSAQSSASSSASGTSAAKSSQNTSRAASSTTSKHKAKAADQKPTRAKINHDIKDHHVTPSDSTNMTKKQMDRVKKNDRKEYSKIVQVRKQAKDRRAAKVNRDIKSGKLTSSDVKQMTPKQWRRTKRTSPKTYRKAVRIQTKSNVKSARKQLREFKKANPKSYRRVVKSSTKLARQVNNLKPSRMSRDVIQQIASTATPQQLNYLAVHNPKVYQKIMAEQDLLGISHVVSSHRSIARMARTMTPRQLAYLAAHNPKLYRKVLAEQDLLGISHMANSRADANAYVNGIDDARLGLLAKSHNAQYLKGYNAFKKANGNKLPQTGEAHGHLSLAAAVLMVLSLAFSLPVLKRKQHDE